MNTIKKTGILATVMGLLALAWVHLDSDADARTQRMTGDTGMECSSPCSLDMTRFAYPVGDGLVVMTLEDFF